MFGKKDKDKSKEQKNARKDTRNNARKVMHNSTPTIIADKVCIFGNIMSEGLVDVEGVIDGNVKAHSAIIRDKGTVNGDVIAESVRIYGKVKGLVKAKSVTLYEHAIVEGVIMHESLSVEDGAFVDGKFKRMDKIFIDDADDDDGEIPFVDEVEAGEDRFETGLSDTIRLVSGDTLK